MVVHFQQLHTVHEHASFHPVGDTDSLHIFIYKLQVRCDADANILFPTKWYSKVLRERLLFMFFRGLKLCWFLKIMRFY